MRKELLFVLVLALQVLTYPFIAARGGLVNASEKAEELWVDMRDEENRKLLVKEGTVYSVKERLRFDISKENLPGGAVSVRIFATDEQGGIWESRVFLVEGN